MTIKWGDPIECNGVRPDWLRDREAAEIENRPGEWLEWGGCVWHRRVAAVRLPADHPAYVALARGFTPWSGGESAPDDWDGGAVLLHDETEWGEGRECTTWNVSAGSRRSIIGYRKRVEYGAVHTDGSRSGGQPAGDRFDEPHLARIEVEGSAPVEGVFIKRMTEAEARAFAKSHGYVGGPEEEHYVGALHDVGLIRPETTAERFTRETGHAVTEAVEAALNWKGE